MKKRILSILIAMSMTMAMLPSFTAGAVDNDRQEIFEHEIVQHAEEPSDSDGPIELMSVNDDTKLTITANNAEIKQGDLIEFSSEQFETSDEDYNGISGLYYGNVTFKGSDEIWTLNYFGIYGNCLINEEQQKIRIPVGSSIPVGEYIVQVDLSNGRSVVEGSFSLKISDQSNNGMELTIEKNVLKYDEYFHLNSSSFRSSAMDCIFTNKKTKTMYFYEGCKIPFQLGIDPGNYELSAYDEDYMSRYSEPLNVTIKDYDVKPVVQNGVIEAYSGYRGVYNNTVSFTESVYGIENKYGIKLVNSDTNDICEDIAFYDLIGNEDDGYTGFSLTQINSEKNPGEYNGYILAGDTIYGPFKIKNYDYYLTDNYYTTLKDDFRPLYHVYNEELFDINEDTTISISIENDNGAVFSQYPNIPIRHIHNYGSYIYFYPERMSAPAVPENGVYILHTEINYSNGLKKELDDRHIYVGEYDVVDFIYTGTHRHLTPDTKEVGYHVRFGNYIDDPSTYSLSLINKNGEVVATSKDWYYFPYSTFIQGTFVSVMYMIAVDNLPEGDYTIRLDNNSTHEMIGVNNITTSCYDTPVEIFEKYAKRINDTTFEFYIENIPAGVYETSDPNGRMTVDSSGKATLITDEAYPKNYSNMWFDIKDYGESSEYHSNIRIDFSETDDAAPDNVCISSATGFIPKESNSIDDIYFTLENKFPLFENNIIAVRLLSDGNIVAEGKNIEYRSYGQSYYNDINCFTTSFYVDFPNIDRTKIVDNSTVLHVITDAGAVEYDLPLLGDDEGDVQATISLPTVANFHVDSPYYPTDYIADRKKIDFTVSRTNKTEGNVILQKYDTNEQKFVDAVQIPLFDLEKSGSGMYTYSGSFSNIAEEGSVYRVRFGNRNSSTFTAVDGDFYIGKFSKTLDLGVSKQQTTINTLNVNTDTAAITAYYINNSGTKVNIPVITDRIVKRSDYTSTLWMTFDFSDVDKFDVIYLHLCVNGEENRDQIAVTDHRNDAEVTSSFLTVQNQQLVMYMSGYNIDKMHPVIKIWRAYEYKGKTLYASQPVKELTFTIPQDSSTSYYVDIPSLGLPNGKYAYVLFSNGKPVYTNEEFYCFSSSDTTTFSVLLNKKTVSDGTVTVNMENISNKNISNAKLIVAAYNVEGALLDVKSQSVNINAKAATGDINVSSVKDAASYKVFLWDDIKTMKPLMFAE